MTAEFSAMTLLFVALAGPGLVFGAVGVASWLYELFYAGLVQRVLPGDDPDVVEVIMHCTFSRATARRVDHRRWEIDGVRVRRTETEQLLEDVAATRALARDPDAAWLLETEVRTGGPRG